MGVMKKLSLRAVLGAALAFPLLGGCSGGPRPGADAMLSENDKSYVRRTLGGMREPVRVVLFSRDGGDCRYCDQAEGLLGEVAALEPQVVLEVLSLRKDAARAADLGIDKVPGIAILGPAGDYGLRYFGLPSGMDFVPFVETLRAVSDGDPGLAPETVEGLAKLAKPVQLTVFVTLA